MIQCLTFDLISVPDSGHSTVMIKCREKGGVDRGFSRIRIQNTPRRQN